MKLHILVDEKLSPGQKISQGCHATAQFLLDNPGLWLNETIIILEAPKFIILEALRLGAIGYTDPYHGSPRACAFLRIPELIEDLKQLALA